MKLLLDTHTFIWFINDDKRLSHHAKSLIENMDNQCFISMASLWEMSIKSSLKKLEIPLPMSLLYQKHIIGNDFEILPTHFKYLQTIHDLPYHHGDPFDRMIIAQSMVENIPIIGCDGIFKEYNVQCFW